MQTEPRNKSHLALSQGEAENKIMVKIMVKAKIGVVAELKMMCR